MEKFSRFRDAGTGIQVFLPPVAPTGSSSPLTALLSLPLLLLAVIRGLSLVLVITLWSLFELALGTAVRGAFLNLVLALLGIFPEKQVVSPNSRNRAAQVALGSPKAGDLILSSHSSPLDILLLLRIFPQARVLLPVLSPSPRESPDPRGKASTTSSRSAAQRRRGPSSYLPESLRGSMEGNTDETPQARRVEGWKVSDSIWQALKVIASCRPLELGSEGVTRADLVDLDSLKKVGSPLIVFPEIVTSNNRALLKPAAAAFPSSWADTYTSTGSLRSLKDGPTFFITTIKYEAPTPLSASPITTVPRSLPSLFLALLSSVPAYAPSIRILNPAESITGSSSSSLSDPRAGPAANALRRGIEDVVADTWSNLSRLRRTALGWTEKDAFLTMYAKR
ncbi:hypothetical protein CBOM_05325 [Ceraceosorus bombacis]|uniref:Phospholipid/glycerol acyltransferase domain-containing protein n=1 Tax=Ceraceosorus bombacis TaxID=401625 RepID=A0A0P1BQG6_9BASI|nr:hypothetical protein CBOM_05325 [Ceraceosorus bombacis]